jgi:Fe-S cluster assembly iron-binding protein IscA
VLTLTDQAVAAVNALTSKASLPAESGGLRIFSHEQPSAQGQLSLSLTRGPQAGDEVVVAGEARVFLEAQAAQVLDQQRLDAKVGPDGGVQFLLGPQS